MLWGIIALIFFSIVLTVFAYTGLLGSFSAYIGLANNNFFSAMPAWLYVAIGLLLFALLIGTAVSFRK